MSLALAEVGKNIRSVAANNTLSISARLRARVFFVYYVYILKAPLGPWICVKKKVSTGRAQTLRASSKAPYRRKISAIEKNMLRQETTLETLADPAFIPVS